MKQSKTKIASVLLMLLFTASTVYAQNCLPTGVTFEDQSDIDDFAINYPGCTNIEGNVRIDPSSSGTITNLNGLSQLTSIGGNLIVINEVEITDFSGLDNLTSIGGDFETTGGVVINSTLTSFAGLENLQSIGGRLQLGGIYQNLTTLDGLNNLNNVAGDIIIQLRELTDISAFSSLTIINGSINLGFLNVLTNLDGLENITTIAGDLIIVIIPMLTDLEGLNSLQSVGGLVQIRNNSMLQNLDGLNALTSIGGGLDISLVFSLTSVEALVNLTSINGRLKVSAATSLTSLDGLENIAIGGITDLEMENNFMLSLCYIENICDYLAIPTNTATISGNSTNCNTRAEVENACLVAVPVELLKFEGVVNEKGLDLEWATATEVNNLGFELHKSKDGNDWHKMAFIAGRGTTSEATAYHFRDDNPYQGANYYRLRQLDFDGAFQYSPVVVVQYADLEKDIILFPNPSNGLVSMQINNASYRTKRVVITDPLGRVVWEDETVGETMLWQKEIELTGQGVFTVHTYSGTERFSTRLVVLQRK